MELKYTVLSGIFPEILTQKVWVQKPLHLLILARPFRIFQNFGQVLVSAHTLFMASVCLWVPPNKHRALLSFPEYS